MNNLLNKIYFGIVKGKRKAKAIMHHFAHDEKGAAEIIAMIVIIGLILVLAFVFRDAIIKLFQNLWNSFVKNADKKEKDPSVDLPDVAFG